MNISQTGSATSVTSIADGSFLPLLRQVGQSVIAGDMAEEEDIRAIARFGADLLEAGRRFHGNGAAAEDVGFFLVAWGVDRIAERRIESGDLGIDEVGGGGPAGEVEEYRRLVDEIVIDTLNEFREFDMVILYEGRPDEYERRKRAGQRVLAKLVAREGAGRASTMPAQARHGSHSAHPV